MPAGMPINSARPSPRNVSDKNSSVCGQNVSWLRAHAFARSSSMMILSESRNVPSRALGAILGCFKSGKDAFSQLFDGIRAANLAIQTHGGVFACIGKRDERLTERRARGQAEPNGRRWVPRHSIHDLPKLQHAQRQLLSTATEESAHSVVGRPQQQVAQ